MGQPGAEAARSEGHEKVIGPASGLAISVVLLAVIAIGDLLVGDETVPITAVVLAPLVSCSFTTPRTTAIVGIGAVLVGFLLALVNGLWETGELGGRLAVIGAGGVIAVLLAAERERRERSADRMQILGDRRDAQHQSREAHIVSNAHAVQAIMRAEQIVDRSELQLEIEMVRQLQSSLLPRSVPSLDALEICANYESADDRAEIGGDWYDAFLIDDTHLGVSLGDVSGHGIGAASLMAQARLGLQLAVMNGTQPGRALRQLDTILERSAVGGDFATVVFGVYDLADHVFTWARAAHCYPILRQGFHAAPLTGRGGPPLGVGLTTDDLPEHQTRLAPGDLLILFTDGLVERRGRPVTEGTEELVRIVTAWDGMDLGNFVESLPKRLSMAELPEDDICVLALRRPPQTNGQASVV